MCGGGVVIREREGEREGEEKLKGEGREKMNWKIKKLVSCSLLNSSSYLVLYFLTCSYVVQGFSYILVAHFPRLCLKPLSSKDSKRQ